MKIDGEIKKMQFKKDLSNKKLVHCKEFFEEELDILRDRLINTSLIFIADVVV